MLILRNLLWVILSIYLIIETLHIWEPYLHDSHNLSLGASLVSAKNAGEKHNFLRSIGVFYIRYLLPVMGVYVLYLRQSWDGLLVFFLVYGLWGFGLYAEKRLLRLIDEFKNAADVLRTKLPNSKNDAISDSEDTLKSDPYLLRLLEVSKTPIIPGGILGAILVNLVETSINCYVILLFCFLMFKPLG